MFHIIYKTTNLINSHIYIGYHFQKSSPYEFDGYYGSGRYLNRAIEKFGLENFRRETLFVFESKEAALAKERELVDASFLSRSDVYNLCEGGGAPPSHKGKTKTAEHRRKIGDSQKGKIIGDAQRQKISKSLTGVSTGPRSDEAKQNISKGLTGRKREPFSEEWCSNMSLARLGEKNSMFGVSRKRWTCTVCNSVATVPPEMHVKKCKKVVQPK
jgi:hypothetical protein